MFIILIDWLNVTICLKRCTRFEKNCFNKGKTNQFKLKWKDKFLSLMWTDHTEYEEYKKLQLCTVVRYQHNNTLCKISSNYRYRKIPIFNIAHPYIQDRINVFQVGWRQQKLETYRRGSGYTLLLKVFILHLIIIIITIILFSNGALNWLKVTVK